MGSEMRAHTYTQPLDLVGTWLRVAYRFGRAAVVASSAVLAVALSYTTALAIDFSALSTLASTDNTVSTNPSFRPHMATDGNGVWVAVWASHGSEPDIMVSRSADNGTTWNTPSLLAGNAGGDSGADVEPRIATNRTGVWVVVWASNQPTVGRDEIGTDFDILVARSTNNGQSWTGPSVLYNDNPVPFPPRAARHDRTPDIATDQAGHWVAVWSADPPPSGENDLPADIVTARSSNNGQTWAAAIAIPDEVGATDVDDLKPRVVSDRHGVWVAVWEQGRSNIGAAHSTDNGGSWGRRRITSTNQTVFDHRRDPAIAADSDGNWVVAWSNSATTILPPTTTFDSDIWVSISSNPVAGWGSPQLLNRNGSEDTGNDEQPSVATDDHGNWLAVWQSTDSLGGTIGTDADILQARSVNDGGRWSFPQPVNSNAASGSGGESVPMIASDGVEIQSTWVALWQRTFTQSVPGGGSLPIIAVSGAHATITDLDFGQNVLERLAQETGRNCDAEPSDEDREECLAALYDEICWPHDVTVTCANKTVLPDAVTNSAILLRAPVKKLITGAQGTFDVTWRFKNGTSLQKSYGTSFKPARDPVAIYHTHEAPPDAATLTSLPAVDLSEVPEVVLHYNADVPCAGELSHCSTPPAPHLDTRHLWMSGDQLFARKGKTGLVIVEYREADNLTPIDFEIVELRPDQPDFSIAALIGSRLQPNKPHPGARPTVREGEPDYIYRHTLGTQQVGQVWAVRSNTDPSRMEVIWQRPGVPVVRAGVPDVDVFWPFEITRYTAVWPEADDGRYQVYLRDEGPDRGPAVSIPAGLNAQLVFEEHLDPQDHSRLEGGQFTSDGPGWSLLKYGTGPTPGQNWVGFEVVRTVAHDDLPTLRLTHDTDDADFTLDDVPWDIGAEIVDPYHEGELPDGGYVHAPEGHRYAPEVFDDTGQIFAVNEDSRVLEVWWSNLGRDVDPDGMEYNTPSWPTASALRPLWPSKPVRYKAQWPDSTKKIVIAQQNGTGWLDPDIYGDDWYIYGADTVEVGGVARGSKEDPTLHGFNPNDEHALLDPRGEPRIFALRDDLATPTTSQPYVLLQYREQSESNLWRFELFRVVREEDPYYLHEWAGHSNPRVCSGDATATCSNNDKCAAQAKGTCIGLDPFEGFAGDAIKGPFPLSDLSYCPETVAADGPAFEDRTGRHHVMAAGLDGGTDTITMRYFYPVRPGFFFPSGPRPVESCVPWLDDFTTVPADVVFTVKWPDVPTMKVGATLIERSFGLPQINGECSVDLVFQQSRAQGGGPSVHLIDPVQVRRVPLEKVPDGIAKERQGAREVFPQLTLALRLRLSFDTVNKQLELQGQVVNPTVLFDYALLNVLTDRDKAELLALSEDTAWKGAINALAAAASHPAAIGNPSCTTSAGGSVSCPGGTDPFDALALSAGLAEGVGYVTLVMQNDGGKCREDAPVSLQVIRVVAELEPGAVSVITPTCPFDETLTLRHQGDFAGRSDDYEFQWCYQADAGGAPPPAPGSVECDGGWLVLPPEPPPPPHPADPAGRGAVDVSIRGPGLRTLSDNWIVARYRYVGSDAHPLKNTWSDWTGLLPARKACADDPKTLCRTDADCTAAELEGPCTQQEIVAQSAPGWIKRVVGDINPFDQRATGGGIEGAENSFFSYANREVNTIVSMISQAGPRWEGDVPLACQGIDDFGLLEIYETVLGRGMELSIDGLPPVDYAPANQALLLAASRIADLYQLLGNEAYADAADPTIAFGTDDGQYGAEATSLHAFRNVTSSLLKEELALLRGRDDALPPGVQLAPLYNRLVWNFTNGQDGGEAAYALNYNILDELGNMDGTIDERDAKAIYPQGHGDAWGHYLMAIKGYYRLLTHGNYTWKARSETVLVGGAPVTVDYIDEAKFATIAAAKARAGAEIVSLTYRDAYVEDPVGQWQGYQDLDTERAWGFSEWAARAGQGTYFDWVVGNAILPAVDPDPSHAGIEKIDRTTVLELREVASRYLEIQSQLDTADQGLNPLGLAGNVIPFDISPSDVAAGKTHFEQIYDRAVGAMNGAITVFNHANNSTQLLRRQADKQADFQNAVDDRERDLTNRLIEAFGYPYPEDIGPGRTYPTGYDGPDLFHNNKVDIQSLFGIDPGDTELRPVTVRTIDVQPNGGLSEVERTVTFRLSTSADRYGEVRSRGATGGRRAPGEVQLARSDLLQARVRFEQSLEEYDNLLADIENQAAALTEQEALNADEIAILNDQKKEQETLDARIASSREKQLDYRTVARIATLTGDASAEALPTSAGLSVDATSAARAGFKAAATVASENASQNADQESLDELDAQQALSSMQAGTNIKLTTLRSEFGVQERIRQLEQAVRRESSQRLALYTASEALSQASGRYLAALARGVRLLDERDVFRRQTAAQVHGYRYKDMAFRIFRNDALQKYRAQFDLAARYVYLAAKAYDYETTLLSNSNAAGSHFLTDIVRERVIGTIQNGAPLTGLGLADPMARMSQNFAVIKPQLGFTNPQVETNRFSLRSELFRIAPGAAGNAVWRETLRRHLVPDLNSLEEFQRYARFVGGAVEPALVIPFSSEVQLGKNFFGWPAGPGDNAYDASHFATKVRSVGVWFSNYDSLSLTNTPRVYLIPVGTDVMRSPSQPGETRQFSILDQKLPPPFTVSPADLSNPEWIPSVDGLADFAGIRLFSSFRAYHDSGSFAQSQVERTDSRAIGRSVWNTRWLLVIPAGTLLADRNEGLERFIGGRLSVGERNGNGVSDIKVFFETYAYSGN